MKICVTFIETILKIMKKSRSFGFLVTFLSCGIVIGFTESIKSEGCRRVTVKICFHEFYIVYEYNGCSRNNGHFLFRNDLSYLSR